MSKIDKIQVSKEEMEKIFSKVLDPSQAYQSGKTIEIYKPEAGRKNLFFVCPSWTKTGPHAFLFFREARLHWRIPPGFAEEDQLVSGRCNRDYNTSCYWCNKVQELRKGTAEEKKISTRCYAKKSYYMQGIDLFDSKDEDGKPKIKIWRSSKKTFEDIKMIWDNFGNFFDLDDGRPLSLSVSQSSKFPTTTPQAYPEKMDFSDFGFSIDDILEAMIDMSQLEEHLSFIAPFSFDEQKRIWHEGKRYDRDYDTPKEETESPFSADDSEDFDDLSSLAERLKREVK